ncbi:MAG: pseudouridine synthase [Aristaeellaceae bacterium]
MLRLDRWLVTLGVGSRSEVQKLVRKGGVQVNHTPVRDPAQQVDETSAVLTVNGQPLDGRLTRHVMLHKPAGLLTAARDKKQPTVMDLLPEVYSAIGCMPVGRLDKDTTGLLLLTTDGEMNHRLLSPGRHVDKTYLAEVDGLLTPSHAESFAHGLHLSDFDAQPALLEIVAPQTGRVTVHEGKFHQIKRMFSAVGLEVTRLHRETFGSLTLDPALPEGAWRELTDAELAGLYQDAQMEAAQ